MRAAKLGVRPGLSRLWRSGTARGTHRPEPAAHRPAQAPVSPRERVREQVRWRVGVVFSLAFLAGDLAGVLVGRLQLYDWSQRLSAYYRQAGHFTNWLSVFADLYSGTFLQFTAVFLLGFSALGPWLLALFFAGKGVVLGLCAAGVYAGDGARGLVVYWLMNCLPELVTLLLLLWLALSAQATGNGLFCSLRGQTPARRAPAGAWRELVFRYLSVLILGAVGCLAGAGSAVFFAGVLL